MQYARTIRFIFPTYLPRCILKPHRGGISVARTIHQHTAPQGRHICSNEHSPTYSPIRATYLQQRTFPNVQPHRGDISVAMNIQQHTALQGRHICSNEHSTMYSPFGATCLSINRLEIDSKSSIWNDNSVVFYKTDSSALLRIPLWDLAMQGLIGLTPPFTNIKLLWSFFLPFPKKIGGPINWSAYNHVENTGFEPVASCLPGKRSSQLS